MKIRLALLLVTITFLSACVRARLYPVQGPLSAQTPVPVFTAKLTEIYDFGKVSVVLSDGEKFKGRWAVAEALPFSTDVTPNASAHNDMPFAWDVVYGPGFYNSHILGAKYFAHSVIIGSKGTVLNMEMYRADPEPPKSIPDVKGVAKDDKGNIYKLVA